MNNSYDPVRKTKLIDQLHTGFNFCEEKSKQTYTCVEYYRTETESKKINTIFQ